MGLLGIILPSAGRRRIPVGSGSLVEPVKSPTWANSGSTTAFILDQLSSVLNVRVGKMFGEDAL